VEELSPWTAWQMATSRQLTAARLHVFTSSRHFTGPRMHQLPNAGHNLPREAPDAFAGAVLELANFRL
jgi:pimeloyl-ACP methyl ester carboxylesterase